MKPSIRNAILLTATLMACAVLAGCGNKGPLVKPSDVPAAAPATATPAAEAPASDAASEPETSSGTPAARH